MGEKTSFDIEKYERQAKNMSDYDLYAAADECHKASRAMTKNYGKAEGYYDEEASVYFRELRKREKERNK